MFDIRDRQTKGSSSVQKDPGNLLLQKISGWLGRRPTNVSLAVLLPMMWCDSWSCAGSSNLITGVVKETQEA